MVYPINPHEGRHLQLGEDTGIDNFNYSNVSIDAYPMSTPTIAQTSAPSNNQFALLANKDENDDDTVVISNKAQKTPNTDNESIATEYAISDSGVTGHFLVEVTPVTNLQVADNPISITISNTIRLNSKCSPSPPLSAPPRSPFLSYFFMGLPGPCSGPPPLPVRCPLASP